MIIGYNFFNRGLTGKFFDTAIPTSQLDEVTMGAGIYDELYVTVDTTVDDKNEKPKTWKLKTVMDAKFENDVEAGSLDSDGHTITTIQIYRRKYLIEDNWLLVGQFPYEPEYNVYSFIDKFTENGARYEYAIVPVSKDVIGDITVSPPIDVKYEGVFISDLHNNYKLEVDFELGTTTHNDNISTSVPLNGKYPIVTRGNQDYQTGSVTFMPLTQKQIESGGMKVNGQDEYQYRQQVLKFLKGNGSKVIRNDNGEMLIVATHGVSVDSKNGSLIDLTAISFSYTQVGDFDFNTMDKGGLIGTAGKSKYTFDENGNIIWALNFSDAQKETSKRKYRNEVV